MTRRSAGVAKGDDKKGQALPSLSIEQLLKNLHEAISNLVAKLKALQVLINSQHVSCIKTINPVEEFKRYQQKYHEFHAIYEAHIQASRAQPSQETKKSQATLTATLESCKIITKEVEQYTNTFVVEDLKGVELPSVHKRLGSNFSKIVRLYRIIESYQKWHAYLLQEVREMIRRAQDFPHLVEKKKLVIYKKKLFLKSALKQQNLDAIVNLLRQYLEQPKYKEFNAKQIYAQLMADKKSLAASIEDIELKLFSNTTWAERAKVMLVLSITQQPNYQLGVLASHAMSKQFEGNPYFPILNVQLPDDLQSQLNTLVGMSFLASSLAMSSWIGYSYQFVATFNHFLLARHDVVKRMSDIVDQVAHYTYLPVLDCLEQFAPQFFQPILNGLKERTHFDEQGFLEKEKFVAWLSGFALQLIFTVFIGSNNLLPTGAAYMLATSCAELATHLANKIARVCKLSTSTTLMLENLAHIVSYSLAYRYGYDYVSEYKRSPVARFSDAQALKLFGLHEKVDEKVLRKRYHQLALENHPDKCGSKCTMPIDDINDAYQVLKKKTQ